ncbi:transcriptional regulator, TraR/DksA family [Kytococcus aerolatus]|uniref:Transcriptional regulator, TraR/DksA family n=1 Tax=Kytococcus aerolatus TaxID=592308 RepID=A0A212T4D5_9MICO|nr:TraR/DksA C4-type zinc finger protein [Kytococcus aerolatus]SNC60885.1 transcriptional regulator, TraR/DksA family [Kytococcus aerolatus]
MATTTAKKPTTKKTSPAKAASSKTSSAKAEKGEKAGKAPKKGSEKETKAPKKASKKTAAEATAKTGSKDSAKKDSAKKTTKSAAKSSKGAAKSSKTAAKKPATVAERLTGQKSAKAKSLVVGRAEEPWSKSELAEVRVELEAELARLTRDLELAESDLLTLVSENIDSTGDEADAGSFSSERQHEMSVAQNSRDLLLQTTHALTRIVDGTYGQCESCHEAIGKMRLQAFPRATLCVPCKQHQERR